MTITETSLAGLLVIEPRRFRDERGFFLETYQEPRYRQAGITARFVQDNQSRSANRVLRGLHFQIKRPQAQLVTLLQGRVFDVAVDLRSGSPTFGKWFGVELSDQGRCQIFMGPGFAHGFSVLSEFADLHYKVSRYYDPADEGGLRWNDPDVGIEWPIDAPLVSPRDAAYPALREIARDQLPHGSSNE